MSTSNEEYNNNFSDSELVFRINSGEYELFYSLLKKYKNLIEYTARKLPSDEYEDLVQEGTIALFNAVKAFKSEKADFSTFASRCINNAMIDVLRRNSAKNKIPDSLLSSLEEIE